MPRGSRLVPQRGQTIRFKITESPKLPGAEACGTLLGYYKQEAVGEEV